MASVDERVAKYAEAVRTAVLTTTFGRADAESLTNKCHKAKCRGRHRTADDIVALVLEKAALRARLEASDADSELAAKDAEIERLREELDALEVGYNAQVGHGRKHWLRAEAAEAKVARVEAAIVRADPPGGIRAGTPTVSVAVLRTALADAPAEQWAEGGA
jgi:hypothetical protein